MTQEQKQWAIEAYKIFSEKGTYEDLGNVVYDAIKECIPFDKRVKREIWEQAFWMQKAELKMAGMREMNENLKYEDKLVIVKAKEISLIRFFKMLEDMDLDIAEYIDNFEQEQNAKK